MTENAENTPLPASISAVIWRDVHAIREGQKEMAQRIESLGGRIVHAEHQIITIHGANGNNGKIGNLAAALVVLQSDVKDWRNRAWWVVGLLLGVLVAVLGGVFVVRDRLTAMEINSERSREDIKEIVRRVEQWHYAPKAPSWVPRGGND